MILGLPRHREPSGLCITPSPQHLTSTFSIASPLFSHFYFPQSPTTLLTSDTCALLPKQRRSTPDVSSPTPQFQRFCPASRLTNKTKAKRRTSTKSVILRSQRLTLGRRTSTASPLTNKTKGNSCATTNNPTNEALSSLESALTQSAPVTPLESALTIYMGGGVPRPFTFIPFIRPAFQIIRRVLC